MNSQPLRVLLVSEDRTLLRQISRFLDVFGYRVQQVAGMEHVQAALECEFPHVLIVDATSDQKTIGRLCHPSHQADSANYLYTLLLVEYTDPRVVFDGLAAGADDFLQVPIVYGELQARLRAAARTIEWERRVQQQEGIDPLTRLPNREAFGQLLRRGMQGGNLACVVADLDLLDRINRGQGYTTGNAVIQAAAEILQTIRGDQTALACLGGGRFGALITNTSLDDVIAWAEQARLAIAEMEYPHRDATITVTASFGVATGPAERLIGWAEEGLRMAKRSGRNCVVCHGQFDDEDCAWNELATSGRIFERTAAHHVMSILPAVLQSDDTAARAKAFLDHTRLDTLVVVDTDGRLAGIITSESDLEDPSLQLSNIMETNLATFNEGTPLAAMLDNFSRESHSRAVITQHGIPTGLITREQLATFTEAVTLDQFSLGQSNTDASDYLVVVDRALAGNTW